jgi:hypothetical protein
MDDEVAAFEESILFFADAFRLHGAGSRSITPALSGVGTPALTPGSSAPSSLASSRVPSRSNSFVASQEANRPLFNVRLSNMLTMSVLPETQSAIFEDPIMDEIHQPILDSENNAKKDELVAWQLEACAVDRSVQILPGVKAMIDSIPAGRYAVATSGAKTYGKFPSIKYIMTHSLTFILVPKLTVV